MASLRNLDVVGDMIVPAGEFQGFSAKEALRISKDKFLKCSVTLGRTTQSKVIRAFIKVHIALQALEGAMIDASLQPSRANTALAIESGEPAPVSRALVVQPRPAPAEQVVVALNMYTDTMYLTHLF